MSLHIAQSNIIISQDSQEPAFVASADCKTCTAHVLRSRRVATCVVVCHLSTYGQFPNILRGVGGKGTLAREHCTAFLLYLEGLSQVLARLPSVKPAVNVGSHFQTCDRRGRWSAAR